MTTRTLFAADPPPASTPLRIVPREVRFPATWDASARRMAEARQMTQAQVDSIERRRWAFRERQRRHAPARRASDAAFEAHWKANEKALSSIPVPPVPHTHAAVEVKAAQSERSYWYFDAEGQPLPNSRALPLGTWFQTVSSPSDLHTLNPVFHGWWRDEWLVVMAPNIRGEMCRQYRDVGGPYRLSEIEVAMWRERARIVEAKENAA